MGSPSIEIVLFPLSFKYEPKGTFILYKQTSMEGQARALNWILHIEPQDPGIPGDSMTIISELFDYTVEYEIFKTENFGKISARSNFRA